MAFVLAAGARLSGAEAPVPLPNAHAHNDYEHARPLLDALAHGFCSVEADIWLAEGKLLVAHNRGDTKPDGFGFGPPRTNRSSGRNCAWPAPI